jgi:hypothetical protein
MPHPVFLIFVEYYMSVKEIMSVWVYTEREQVSAFKDTDAYYRFI